MALITPVSIVRDFFFSHTWAQGRDFPCGTMHRTKLGFTESENALLAWRKIQNSKKGEEVQRRSATRSPRVDDYPATPPASPIPDLVDWRGRVNPGAADVDAASHTKHRDTKKSKKGKKKKVKKAKKAHRHRDRSLSEESTCSVDSLGRERVERSRSRSPLGRERGGQNRPRSPPSSRTRRRSRSALHFSQMPPPPDPRPLHHDDRNWKNSMQFITMPRASGHDDRETWDHGEGKYTRGLNVLLQGLIPIVSAQFQGVTSRRCEIHLRRDPKIRTINQSNQSGGRWRAAFTFL